MVIKIRIVMYFFKHRLKNIIIYEPYNINKITNKLYILSFLNLRVELGIYCMGTIFSFCSLVRYRVRLTFYFDILLFYICLWFIMLYFDLLKLFFILCILHLRINLSFSWFFSWTTRVSQYNTKIYLVFPPILLRVFSFIFFV